MDLSACTAHFRPASLRRLHSLVELGSAVLAVVTAGASAGVFPPPLHLPCLNKPRPVFPALLPFLLTRGSGCPCSSSLPRPFSGPDLVS